MQPMDEVYKQYSLKVYKYLLSLTRDEQFAEELTQETFCQAIRSSDRYDESCALSTWLCGIAKNVLRTYYRKHPMVENIEDQNLHSVSAEEEVVISENRVELFRMLHELSEPYREVMYLRIFGGLSFREIGEVHGRTENWARVTFYRGKNNIRKEVDDYE